MTHYAGCGIFFNKDTFYPDISVKSIYLHDTRRGLQDQVVEGEQGWVYKVLAWWWKVRWVGLHHTSFTHLMLTPISRHQSVFFLCFSFLFCRIMMYVDCSCGVPHATTREAFPSDLLAGNREKACPTTRLSRLRCASQRRCTEAQRFQRTDGVH